eukprot:TRINITY_DN49180_c0_g1_i1.p1 TRINITY_DN49180_c0_g1~~TRINITY_DN49180_c0_g1_i1.p1  ORF type:complete len:175 (-),score=15.75 TRINITY_DN49180_c0_g1_i1:127-582(-)
MDDAAHAAAMASTPTASGLQEAARRIVQVLLALALLFGLFPVLLGPLVGIARAARCLADVAGGQAGSAASKAAPGCHEVFSYFGLVGTMFTLLCTVAGVCGAWSSTTSPKVSATSDQVELRGSETGVGVWPQDCSDEAAVQASYRVLEDAI